MRFAIVAICICISFGAFAQHSSVVSKLLPARGSYYDRAKPGTGIEVDVDGNGLLFIAFNSYSPAGAPVWYLILGSFQPASEAQRLATDTIGGITSPLPGAVASQPVAARTAIVTLRASLRNLPEVGFGPRFALGSANSGIRLPPSGSMIYVFDCGFNFGASVPCPASSLWTDIFSVLGLDLAATAPATPIASSDTGSCKGPTPGQASTGNRDAWR